MATMNFKKYFGFKMSQLYIHIVIVKCRAAIQVLNC